ncbi:RNA dependent RNA polymerase [Botrytis cinerea mitovirus 3]|uniref:RNA dependent RNA polymerase n=1 Tax=Botrytis cinerea mitovirus 3 TaxID=1629666 RepID=A0A0S4GAV3_9VIRU|nr:RNA dependent RNA polymerase [Botrytis cinerea mitovirus 3]CEZ26298.1 RNA dependent RNA polymerase [Botrytis cinerea mitovirus 3]
MKITRTYKNLNSLLKSSIVKTKKMFSIRDSISNSLSIPLRQIQYLSFGKIRGLANRALITRDFMTFVLKMKKNHGADFTIKWLKCCYVALQKSLGKDNLESLRDLEPNLPLPRLINGIPAIISSNDRKLIREMDSRIIIYWSSLFSLYRVLKCSYKLKISSITDPFKGSINEFNDIIQGPVFSIFFDRLNGFPELVKKSNLAPSKVRLLRSSSSSNNVSWHGIITDSWNISNSKEMSSNVSNYLASIKALGWNTMWFNSKLNEMIELGDRLNQVGSLKTKKSLSGQFGQFSLKEEAAGKLRIFAIVDSITQSLLSPLHDFMFDLLKKIPNDGTFDQDLSVKRSQVKSLSSGKAFSFDLSAATDRLPVDLTVKILSKIFSDEFGTSWKQLMVNRDFFFSLTNQKDYGAPESLRYSVGQPMGALSSWPALALTHHWILQYCSNILGRTGWEENYEILGDDLVVFDSALADKYLEIAKILGVEINLTKSISSHDRPVFEFAKRTCFGNSDLSPISIKQLLSNDQLSERTMNVVSFLKRGLLVSRSHIGILLSKFGSWQILKNKKLSKTPLLAILGILNSMNLISHRWLTEALIDPKSDFDNLKDITIPQESIIKLIREVGKVLNGESLALQYPYSKMDDRGEIYDDYLVEFANVIANTAYTKAKALEANMMNLISKEAKNLYNSFEKSQDPTLASAIEGWFEDLLYSDGVFDIDELVDSIESNKAFYYRQLDMEKALAIEDQVNKFIFNYELTPQEFNSINVESAPIMKILSKIVGGHSSRYLKIQRPN